MKIENKINTNRPLRTIKILLFILILSACEDFVEVDFPVDELTGAEAFENTETINASLAYIHSELRESAFSNGGISGLSYLMGHYTDELELFSLDLPVVQGYATSNVLPSDSNVKGIWDTSYTLIHALNSIIEGISSSEALTTNEADRFLGEAHFLRAYIHFNLLTLFGEVPYLKSSDYRLNSQAERMETVVVYQEIIEDLQLAKNLIPASDTDPERFRPDHWTVRLFLSRVYLQQKEWEAAAYESSLVIANSGYTLNTDLGTVFLKDSPETLWQLDSGIPGRNTREGSTFVILNTPPSNSALSSYLLDSFEAGDARFVNWVGQISDDTTTWFFSNKYKENLPTATTLECSILFRLAEAYLIAAEAQAQIGELDNSLKNLNLIRERANLPPVETMDKNSLLESIYKEKRIEFFSEQGHRFLDLKRTGTIDKVLLPIKPQWDITDKVLPLPESELMLNPKLLPQNDGY